LESGQEDYPHRGDGEKLKLKRGCPPLKQLRQAFENSLADEEDSEVNGNLKEVRVSTFKAN